MDLSALNHNYGEGVSLDDLSRIILHSDYTVSPSEMFSEMQHVSVFNSCNSF